MNQPALTGMVTYAGQQLYIEKVTRWDQRLIETEDGADKLFLHVTVGVQAYWNPAATASGKGKMGLESVSDLKQTMMEKRKRLQIVVGGKVVLEAPARKDINGFYARDAKNGPNPIALNVIQITGVKTALVYFEVECWLAAECPGRSQGKGKLSVLSHRWTMSHEYDELMYCTRRIRGRAVFRTDILFDEKRMPDDFRARLYHPTLPRFQRAYPSVVQNSEGNAVDYELVDRQVPVNKTGLTTGGVPDLVNGQQTHPILKARGVWKFGLSKGAILSGFHRYVSMTVEAWGAPTASRIWPIRSCFQMVASFGFIDLLQWKDYYKFDMVVDMWEKYARIDCGIILDGVFGNGFLDLGLAPGQFLPFNTVKSLFTGATQKFPEEMKGVTSVDDATFNNPILPGSNGSRGTYLERLVSQALMQTCDTPAVPTNRPRQEAEGTF